MIRTATRADLQGVGELAGRLVRMHHDLDPKRFMALPDAARGYARYLGSELDKDDMVLLVAVTGSGDVVGYAYARVEGRDYNELLEAHGKLHDVYVDETVRGRGVGEALVREAVARLTAKGAPRVVLSTAVQNASAQRLFQRLGFHTTMLEMTREADV